MSARRQGGVTARRRGGGLVDDDIDEFSGHEDDFADGFSGQEGLGFFGGEGDFFDLGLRRLCWHADAVAQFAVHLDGEFEGILDEQGGIVFGPRLIGEGNGRQRDVEGRLVGEPEPDFFGQVWGERLQQDEELREECGRFGFPIHGFVDKDHQGRDGSVEPEVVEVVGDLLDAGVEGARLLASRFEVADGGGQLDAVEEFRAAVGFGGQGLFEFEFAFFVDEEPPGAAEESVNAFDAFGAPGFHHFERAHEHFVQAEGVGTVVLQDFVGIDNVLAGLGHFLAVFAEDEALVDEAAEGLRGGDVAEVEEHFMPEAGVEEVEDGVFGSADV